MEAWRVVRELKRDALGCVELLEGPDGRAVRRVASGGRAPGSRLVARLLLGRERRALERLAGTAGVPRVVAGGGAELAPALDGRVPRARDVLVREYVAGEPLHLARRLPRDFFDRLDELVVCVHACGVCHNDLHKEQNVVVDERGYPALIDFQLASLHMHTARAFRVRCGDDLRHVQKHRRRYTRDGRGPSGEEHGAGHGSTRSIAARLWLRSAKPLYVFVTRRLLRMRDGEERRESSGPWPEWDEPLGPRPYGT